MNNCVLSGVDRENGKLDFILGAFNGGLDKK